MLHPARGPRAPARARRLVWHPLTRTWRQLRGQPGPTLRAPAGGRGPRASGAGGCARKERLVVEPCCGGQRRRKRRVEPGSLAGEHGIMRRPRGRVRGERRSPRQRRHVPERGRGWRRPREAAPQAPARPAARNPFQARVASMSRPAADATRRSSWVAGSTLSGARAGRLEGSRARGRLNLARPRLPRRRRRCPSNGRNLLDKLNVRISVETPIE